MQNFKVRVGWIFVWCLVVFCGSVSGADLDQILSKMEAVGKTLKSMKADIQQKKWTDIIEEYDAGEEGTLLFLRAETVYLRKDITQPTNNSLVIREGEVTFYEPAIKQAQRYQLGKHGDKAEFLLLGFGSDSAMLKETYDIEYLGDEAVEGTNCHRLQLKPKSDKVGAFFTRIELWIDPGIWVPVQQKLVEPTEDHLLIRFSNIELNAKISKGSFKVKLDKDTKIIGG